MTRETKVGLVVAGSFVVLVGIVVASKMRGGAAPTGTETAQNVRPGSEESERPEKPSPVPEVKPELPKPSPDIKPVAAIDTPGTFPLPSAPPVPIVPPPPFGGKEELPPLSVAITDADKKKVEEEDHKNKLALLAKANEPTGSSGPPDIPGKPKEKDTLLPPVPPAFGELKKNDLPPVPPPGKIELPPIPPPPGTTGELPPIAAPKKDESSPPPIFPGAKKDELPPISPPGKDPTPPIFPAGKTGDLPPPVFPPVGKEPKKDTIALPPIDPGPFGKKAEGPVVPPPDPGPFEKKTPGTPPPPVGIGLPEIKDRKDPPKVPPLGADLKTPPGGSPSTLPKVTTVDIPPYALRADDRDIASISQRLYGSERYADALLAFNRAHPLCKDEIRRTPPVLVPGQMLYIPPKELLESKYASLIVPDGRPVIGATGGPEIAPVKIGAIGPPPVGSGPGVGAPPIGTPPIEPPVKGTPVSLGTPGGAPPGTAVPTRTELTKKFTIAGSPQHIMQIAQQTLGDSRRWPEIYRLNPSLQPQNLIPSGTELRLPVDARVP